MKTKTPTPTSTHVVLATHPHLKGEHFIPIDWGNPDAIKRGPIVGSLTDPMKKNAIGSHGGSYTVYRALAKAAGQLEMEHRPDLTNTAPVEKIGPFDSWHDPEKIVSLDPWGAEVAGVFQNHLKNGLDIRPSIAVTKAHISMPEINEAIAAGRLPVDGKIVVSKNEVAVTKAAVEPAWYLPGIAKRFNVGEGELRRVLFEQTGGIFPELVTRPDLSVLLPPIGSSTVYMFGDVNKISDESCELTARVHDECNGSDVFGSDICTCRPYLTHGIEEAIKTAQKGGSGLIVYYRKEGRALGEVTKFLVYNARKRQKGGDSATNYFYRTECVAGVQDMRFQELMPDVLQWLGIKRIDNLVSMSDMKYDAITKSGISVGQRVSIPQELIPQDAMVEMEAKKAAGYFSPEGSKTKEALDDVQGRTLDD